MIGALLLVVDLGQTARFWRLLVVGCTRVLLMATARPFWSGSPLMPGIFLASAYTTGAALLVLLGNRGPGLHRISFNFALIEVVLVVLHLIWTYPLAKSAVQAALTSDLAWRSGVSW